MALMDQMRDNGEAGLDMKPIADIYCLGGIGSKPIVEIMVPKATVIEVISTSDEERRKHLQKRRGIRP